MDYPTLSCMANSYDGAHCGLADWYPEIEAGITAALADPATSWSTGWYSSKKEIASAKIDYDADSETLTVHASVSDDFDTEGMGWITLPWTQDLETIAGAIYQAWDDAEDDRRSKQAYEGYSLIVHKGNPDHGSWIATYLIDVSGNFLDYPPGDNYAEWGWQEDLTGPELEAAQTLEREVMDEWVTTGILLDAPNVDIGGHTYTLKLWS